MLPPTCVALTSTLEKSCWADAKVATARRAALSKILDFMALSPSISLLANLACRCGRGRHRGGFHLVVKVGSGQVEVINHSFVPDEIDFPALIRRERSDPLRRSANLADYLERAVLLLESKDA